MEEEDGGVWGTRVDVSVQGSGALTQAQPVQKKLVRVSMPHYGMDYPPPRALLSPLLWS